MRIKRNWTALAIAACLLLESSAVAAGMTQEEAQYQYLLRRAEMVHSLGLYETWPVSEKAALDTYRESLGHISGADEMRILPGQEDLPQEAALRAGMDAVMAAYPVDRAALEACQISYDFLTTADRLERPYWRLCFQSYGENTGEVPPAFLVRIESPSGQVLACEGQYSMAVINEPPNCDPRPGEISMEKALEIAFAYTLEHYDHKEGMTAELLSYFTPMVLLYEDAELGRVYSVQYNPMDSILFDYFGPYDVIIDAATGTPLDGYTSNG